MKYYEVKAKCGHVGRNYYVLKNFAVMAENGRKAAEATRSFPRVKHHHKDAIRDVTEIDETRYLEIMNINEADPYFQCKCIQDQRSYIEPDIYPEEREVQEEQRSDTFRLVYSGKTTIKKPKKYVRNYRMDAEREWMA